MDATRLKILLDQLSVAALNVVLKGQALLLVDDASLALGDPESPNVLVHPEAFTANDADQLRRALLENSEELIAGYYRTHPLSWAGFDRQVKALFEAHGYETFAALPDVMPVKSLFVEQGTVIAEAQDSPRFQYGTYCELPGASGPEQIKQAVERWVSSGQAYDSYLGMNVCRHNC
ncbi:MAG TPA: hypothetical protein VIU36_06105 [Gammaproteobacteria bacterium]|jgi:hypothetical protein